MGKWKDPVVVGYDTSRESKFALTWAAEVAQRRGVALIVVHATGVERSAVELARPGILEMYKRRALEIAEQGASRARKMISVPVQAAGVQSGAAAALVEQSNRASLVVVGYRGRSLLPGALLGGGAFTVATHAACPVAVVRRSPRPLPSMENPIVVGVDGSEHSGRALDEAAFLAADTHSFLRIVVAWRRPDQSLWASVLPGHNQAPDGGGAKGAPAGNGDSPAPAWQSPGTETNRIYEELLSDLSGRAEETASRARVHVQQQYPDLKVETVVIEGRAASAIVAASADASMIAMGARGHGDLKSLLLGSVSRRVMQRAECAVYVMR